MNANTLRLAAALALLTLCSPAAAEQTPKLHRPGLETLLKKLGYIPIPLTRSKDNHLCVKAEVEGKEHFLSVDTGWSITTLTKSIGKKLPSVESLGAHVEDPVLGSLDKTGLSLIKTLKLGLAQFANEPVIVESLSADGDVIWQGVLGADFFSRHFCLIDCLDLRLYVRGGEPGEAVSQAITNSLAKSGYVAAPLKKTQSLCLSCEFEINSGTATLLIDTGSLYTVLDDAAAIRCKLPWQKTGERIVGGVSGIRATSIYATGAKTFRAGGADMPLHRLKLGIADLSDWKIGRKEPNGEKLDGMLGGDLIAANGALIDFVGCVLWFNPDPQ
jgi:predicted aspartyl protease